jgi:hypothetical protein
MTWPWVLFQRTEFQDMTGETVDEDDELVISKKNYFGRKRVFEAYDTKYLRGDMKASQSVHVHGYQYSYFTKIALFMAVLKSKVIHMLPTKPKKETGIIIEHGKEIQTKA